MTRKLIIGFGLVVALIAVIGGAWLYACVYLPHHSFGALIHGSDDVVLQDFEIEGRGRRILCTDPEVRRALADAMRAASAVGAYSSGRSYVLKAQIRPGGSWEAMIYVDEQEDSFVIAYWDSLLDAMLTFSDPQHYEVSIGDVRGEVFTPLFDAMRGEQRGTIMIGG